MHETKPLATPFFFGSQKQNQQAHTLKKTVNVKQYFTHIILVNKVISLKTSTAASCFFYSNKTSFSKQL